MSIKLMTLMIAATPLLVSCIFLPMSAEEKAKYAEYHRQTESPATYEAMDCNALLITQTSYEQYPTPRTEKIRQVIGQVVSQRGCTATVATSPKVATNASSATQTAPSSTPAQTPPVAVPVPAVKPVPVGRLGAHISPVTPAVVKNFGLPSEKGVLVFGPESGIDVAQMELLPGDIILEIAGKTVNSPSDVTTIISRMSPGESASLKVWRYRTVTDVRVVVSDGANADQPL
jgi:serine protease Do